MDEKLQEINMNDTQIEKNRIAIIELVNRIDNLEVLIFIQDFIGSVKRKWGI